ncbi:peptidase associated/transthyretin-like domain-containing protein [Niabella soli]|uniref:Uncharacterized protein n=1 Tax=Niabella soli DSM 19437 TaxID=929713 RepID=W0F3E2_9BACT|nr:hypothetical protein [Niabella soli]AHF17547.1 hypothetical protein NIASO_09650 [Niabella soli DSM 19437]
MLRALTIFILLLSAATAFSQTKTYLKGNIFLYSNDTPVPGATITNLNTRQSSVSTSAGTYQIPASNKDIIVFSSSGLKSDTVKVEEQLLKTGYDVGLTVDGKLLKNVTVTSSYQLDSLRRRGDYAKIYEKQPGLTGGNTPEAGFGLVLSPISYFSKRAKKTRQFRKRLKKEEEDAYIDYVFSPMWVSKLTGLKGDSLHLFLYQYRPTYDMARMLDRPSMIAYINDRYKEFIRKKD